MLNISLQQHPYEKRSTMVPRGPGETWLVVERLILVFGWGRNFDSIFIDFNPMHSISTFTPNATSRLLPWILNSLAQRAMLATS